MRPEVPATAFGPRLQALVALLSGRYRLSRREVAALCADLLRVGLCTGSVQRLCAQTAAALRAPVAALEAAIRTAPVAHADETSWAEAGQHTRWRRCSITSAWIGGSSTTWWRSGSPLATAGSGCWHCRQARGQCATTRVTCSSGSSGRRWA